MRNLRDVGEVLHLLADRPLLPHGVLLRGGALSPTDAAAALGHPATVINLRLGPDPQPFPAHFLHLPRPDGQDTYDTTRWQVRRWLQAVLHAVAGHPTPVLLHCASGKDRTGVAVAALLHTLGVPRPLIEAEYLFSEGDVQRAWIAQALDGFAAREDYFEAASAAALRRHLGPAGT